MQLRIHEENRPVVLARPPRGPKASPIVDSSNTRPIVQQQQQQQQPKKQRSTDVSKQLPPKAPTTATTATTTNTTRPSSCRNATSETSTTTSMSTSMSNQSAHFLSAFNVNDCFDVRSIPDPPTPQPRNRRRLSSPMLLNPAMAAAAAASTETPRPSPNPNPNPKPSSKRSRKSLCHVPSPALLPAPRDASAVVETAAAAVVETAAASPPPKALQARICLEADDTDDNSSSNNNREASLPTSSHKRRKKRQSMELPLEWVQEYAAHAPTPSPAPTPHVNAPMPGFAGDLQSMKDLQQLVRAYCRVPNEQRSTCALAKSIESATDYPMGQPVLEHHPLSHANRRSVLSKMAPIIEEIDRRKLQEVKKWEYETECRVERSRSGKYRYICQAMHTKVGSQEYKRRYVAVLDRDANLRLQRADEWKVRLVDSEPVVAESIGCSRDSAESANEQVWDTLNNQIDEGEDSFAVTQELDLDLGAILGLDTKSSEETVESEVPTTTTTTSDENTSMELCDASVSIDMDMDMGGWDPIDHLRSAFEPPAPVDTPPRSSPPRPSDVEKTIAPTVSAESEEETALLPLPDREEESKDPDIARAEQKLWSRIDAALQDYSEEVVEIQHARRTTSTTTSTVRG